MAADVMLGQLTQILRGCTKISPGCAHCYAENGDGELMPVAKSVYRRKEVVDIEKYISWVEDPKGCGRKPMLCWKRDRKPWLAFVPMKELVGHSFMFRLEYRAWSAVALDELLKLSDGFFLTIDGPDRVPPSLGTIDNQ